MFLAFRYLDLARRQFVFCRQFSQLFGQGKDREGTLQSKSTRQRAEKQQQNFKLILDVHVAWSETRVPQNPMVGNFVFALFNDQ